MLTTQDHHVVSQIEALALELTDVAFPRPRVVLVQAHDGRVQASVPVQPYPGSLSQIAPSAGEALDALHSAVRRLRMNLAIATFRR